MPARASHFLSDSAPDGYCQVTREETGLSSGIGPCTSGTRDGPLPVYPLQWACSIWLGVCSLVVTLESATPRLLGKYLATFYICSWPILVSLLCWLCLIVNCPCLCLYQCLLNMDEEAWYHSALKIITDTTVHLWGRETIFVCEHLIKLLTWGFLGRTVTQPLNNGGQNVMRQIRSGDGDNGICPVSEFGERMPARMSHHLCWEYRDTDRESSTALCPTGRFWGSSELSSCLQ